MVFRGLMMGLLGTDEEPEMLRVFGKTEMELERPLCVREGLLGLCCPREFTVCITVWASGPS